ncbi:50S ribosomal protein L28 [Neoehrlichia mikurensis]|uniref:Large ribosomal subunit protein bL28 n=1 Tax=Neoehrlichia mikurensis TaxID=89586 RepID=A0A9Q9BZZ5_9RICK|nr:50S ribosomal protein L28 [Neoehrlichia mikurensis]QXK91853.1 50S ribosomal protein L28 [Neoehrlichia mikurensis]QXK93066.1 50S ribosomal protein L28 [Neoehrlichia mikurensis]QXK93545.1 50S ribosomal protein L28 [Neoehrlichia mikurensis]UTO55500.1 50S ribosomal protein L28 [Neoehrlichia mikurensis]UTO56422.1 50S ribosomal protein L28 [Neoehrlichia mikurensis]
MSRVCDITGRSKLFGNKVSHSNRKTKRSYLVNLHNTTLISDVLGRSFKLKLASRTLRTVNYKGGLDLYLLNTSSRKLTDKAKKIKNAIKKVMLAKEIKDLVTL